MKYQPPWEPITLILIGDIITRNFQDFRAFWKNLLFPFMCTWGPFWQLYRDSLHKPIDEGSHHFPPIGTSSVHVSRAISGGIFKLWSRMTCQWSNHNPWRIHVYYTFFFTATWGNDPIWQFDEYFSKWVEPPPTRYLLAFYPFKNQGNPM